MNTDESGRKISRFFRFINEMQPKIAEFCQIYRDKPAIISPRAGFGFEQVSANAKEV
jgi:hypothetical protein